LGETLILAVSFEANDAHRQIISETLGKIADIRYPSDLKTAERQDILSRTDVLLAKNTAKEIRPEELPLLCTARLIQFLSRLHSAQWTAPEIPLAANGGAYAQQMAEHALAPWRSLPQSAFSLSIRIFRAVSSTSSLPTECLRGKSADVSASAVMGLRWPG
jgi:hypothetical protein